MKWSITRISSNSIRVTATPRNSTNNIFTTNINVVSGALDRFKFYAYGLAGDDRRKPYFNDFLITTTSADVMPPVVNLASGIDNVTWVAKGGTISLLNSDVSASDNSGTANVTFNPTNVNTAVDGLTKVTYTATDPSGNTATVVRVIAVGNASPGWCKLHYPKSATASAINSSKVYGRIYIDGATPGPGQATNITAELGVNTIDSDPSGWTGTGVWRAATYNDGFTGGDDEYESTINGAELTAGTYYYAYRFKIGSGAWQYAGINADGTDGGPWNGTTSLNGILKVVPVRNVTFAVDMNVQISKGAFVPSSGQAVELKGNYNSGWTGAGIPMTDLDGDGIYTVTVPIQGNSGDSVVYKFHVTGSATGGLEWEGSSDRPLVLGAIAETLKPVTFSNEGTTFAVWSGGATLNSANLAKYAIGGATGLSANDGQTPVVGGDATSLTLTAIVRDDASLNVMGEAVTSLENFNNPNAIASATVSDAADQTLLPANCKRKVFSVDRGTDDKKFLRIRVTK